MNKTKKSAYELYKEGKISLEKYFDWLYENIYWDDLVVED